MLVTAFVLVADPVQVEEICDDALLEALDRLALQSLQRPDLLVADVVPVFILRPEFLLATVGRGAVREPPDQRPAVLGVVPQFRDDAFQQVEQRRVVPRRLRE